GQGLADEQDVHGDGGTLAAQVGRLPGPQPAEWVDAVRDRAGDRDHPVGCDRQRLDPDAWDRQPASGLREPPPITPTFAIRRAWREPGECSHLRRGARQRASGGTLAGGRRLMRRLLVRIRKAYELTLTPRPPPAAVCR